MVKLLNEHKEAHLAAIKQGRFESSSVNLLGQLQGQVNAIEYLLDFETFFETRLEERDDGKLETN